MDIYKTPAQAGVFCCASGVWADFTTTKGPFLVWHQFWKGIFTNTEKFLIYEILFLLWTLTFIYGPDELQLTTKNTIRSPVYGRKTHGGVLGWRKGGKWDPDAV